MDCGKIESGMQLFSRLSQRVCMQKLHPIIFHCGPYPNELIGITGAAETGKILIITDFVARCILPCSFGGNSCGAVLINTDHHFDMLKLINVMEMLIKEYGDQPEANIELVIKNSLNNLIILNCYDSHQMQLTFLNLEKTLSENLNIGLVVLESLSTFYWEYRMGRGIVSFQHYHFKILESLRSSIQNCNVVLIFTVAESELTEKEAYTLNESYKIILKHSDNNKYIAYFTDCVRNISKTFLYTIDGVIKFL